MASTVGGTGPDRPAGPVTAPSLSDLAKGRPAEQVGSLTAAPGRIPAMFDWAQLSPRLTEHRVRQLMDALWGAGPFGFRGPAAARLPDHLTQLDQGVRTTQVIAPGSACPSVDRHGSLPIEEVRRAAAPLGLRVRLGAAAQRRLQVRGYAEAPV